MAQAAVNERQIILAAEITVDPPDFGHLEPMLDTTLKHLHRHGVTELPAVVVADAGYWHTRQMTATTNRGIPVLVPLDGGTRDGVRPGWENGLYDQMRQALATETGHARYKQRKITIEPVYGQIKHNREPRLTPRGRRRGRKVTAIAVTIHRPSQTLSALSDSPTASDDSARAPGAGSRRKRPSPRQSRNGDGAAAKRWRALDFCFESRA